MKVFKEFKTFIARGNVIDMAVGIIIGSAFTKIVTSLVNDIITPAIGLVTGKVNVAELAYTIKGQKEGADIVLKYGSFIQAIIDFLIIAFVVFLMVTAINKFHDKLSKKEEEAPAEPPKPTKEEELLTEIRDLLKNK